MKNYLITCVITALILSPLAMATVSESQTSILDSQENENCMNKTQGGDNIKYHECLNSELLKSSRALRSKYDKKLEEIRTSSDYDFYDGINDTRKSLRPKIERSYKTEQATWITYRDSYCKNIVSGELAGDSAFVGNVSCIINMNKRRIEEINLMYNPASAW